MEYDTTTGLPVVDGGTDDDGLAEASEEYLGQYFFEVPLPRHESPGERYFKENYFDYEAEARKQRGLLRMQGRADELGPHFQTKEAYNEYMRGWLAERDYAAEYAPETMGARHAPGYITGGEAAQLAIQKTAEDLLGQPWGLSTVLFPVPMALKELHGLLHPGAIDREHQGSYIAGRNAYLQTIIDPDDLMHQFTNTAPMIGIALIPGGQWAAAGFAGTQAYGSASMEYESRAAAMEFAYDETDAVVYAGLTAAFEVASERIGLGRLSKIG